MNEKKIARIAYEACREWDKMSGNLVAAPWKEASQSVKDHALEMVQYHLATPFNALCDHRETTHLFRAAVMTLTNEDSQ